jgi:hypothetical protein
VHNYTERQILAVLPLTRHLAPFYDALVCSRAYGDDIEERTVQSFHAIVKVVGKLVGLLVLHLLTVLHAAAAAPLFKFVTWLEDCGVIPKHGATSSNIVQQDHRKLCPSEYSVLAAIQLHCFTHDMLKSLQLLLTSIADQSACVRIVLYHCLSATLRILGKLFAENKSPLRQALWQLIVDVDKAVYSQ